MSLIHKKSLVKRKSQMVCKPGSIVGNHSSGITITDKLKQPTLRQPGKDTRLYKINLSVAVCLRLVLLPIGFVVPRNLSARAVSSYLTFSPSPMQANLQRQIIFCDAFHRVTPPGRYPVLCPWEARTFLQPKRVSDCPTI